MTATIPIQRHTPETVLGLEGEALYELVDGQLIEKQMSELANETAVFLSAAIFNHAHPKGLGRVMAEQSFRCFPHDADLIRRPDVAFIAAARLPVERFPGHVGIAPDLAVEVVSPNDLLYDMDEKLNDYRLAGVKLTWVVNPIVRTITVYRGDGTIARLFEGDVLSGESVLPDFSSKVADLLPAMTKPAA